MPNLCQIIAVNKGIKNETAQALAQAFADVQKPDLFKGIARQYEPKDEDGERFPPEKQHVQKRAADIVNVMAESLTKLWDIALTQDSGNCIAKTDVIVDGKTIVKDAPVTFLLFLEKQLTEMIGMVKRVPVLDPSEVWSLDAGSNVYATEQSLTTKSKKVPRAFTKAPATPQHPAQVEMLAEDVVVGNWKTIKFSGAMPQKSIDDILQRIIKLQTAVKFAREEANTIAVTSRNVGKDVFAFLLA